MSDFSQPLNNSTRYINQLTYTPVESSGTDRDEPIFASRALQKFSFVSSMNITPGEIELLKVELKEDGGKNSELNEAILGIEKGFPGEGLEIEIIKVIGSLNADSLIQIGERIGKLREQRFEEAAKAIQSLVDYQAKITPSDIAAEPSIDQITKAEIIESKSDQRGEITSENESLVSSLESPTTDTAEVSITIPETLQIQTSQPSNNLKSQTFISEILEAFVEDHEHKEKLKNLEGFAIDYQIPLRRVTQADILAMGTEQVENTKSATEAFRRGLQVEPIGYLHLERVAFTPAGEERGELVYTVPLSPKEKVNITHKEWSSTTSEYEELVTDFLDEYSEIGVTEKNELSEAVNTQEQHSSAFNTGATASGDFFGVKFSATVGYSTKDSFNQSTSDSIKKTRESTNKASSRVKKEHKQSFKVATTTQITDESVRTIENPHEDKVMRVDYYRMMRKWKVDLHRYGVRLTYDINIPEPGLGMLSKILEIRAVEQLLNEDFDKFFRSTADTDYGINELLKHIAPLYKSNTYTERRELPLLAGKFGARIEQLSNETYYRSTQLRYWKTKAESEKTEIANFEFKFDARYFVPSRRGFPGPHVTVKVIFLPSDGYTERIAQENDDIFREPDSAYCQYPRLKGNTEYSAVEYKSNRSTSFSATVPVLVSSDGKFTVSLRIRNISFVSVAVYTSLQLTDSAIEKWQQKNWKTIYDAAYSKYEERKIFLQAMKDNLEAELGDSDTLSLRRMERDEVMKNALRWMFGPGFRYILPGMKESKILEKSSIEPLQKNSSFFYNPHTQSVKQFKRWKQVRRHGKLIEFIHQAIEWENMIYFMYPYFWVDPTEWQDKLYLDHPDPLHKAFLKAGSARVVLPIRPGFEEKFTRFIEEGELAFPSEGAQSPYITIAEEMKNFANANYPGIRSANPVRNVRPLLTYKQREAWEDMQQIMQLLENYKKEMKRYPENLEELKGFDDKPSQKVLGKKDPWKRAYYYQYPGDYGEYDLASWGANKKKEADDTEPRNLEDADITSWAEASLIATWYEYTPTSALDIDLHLK